MSMTAPATGQIASPALRDDTFTRAERGGWRLLLIGRSIAITVIAAYFVATQTWGLPLIYILGVLALFLANGAALYLISRVNRAPRWITFVIVAFDTALVAFFIFQPNPFKELIGPDAYYLRESDFAFLLVAISLVALTLSPGIVVWCGFAVLASWGLVIVWVLARPESISLFNNGNVNMLPRGQQLTLALNPNYVDFNKQIGLLVVAGVVAGVLALAVARSRHLARDYAKAERDRASLARYFSPNMIDELARIEQPFGPVRRQDIAVLFIDIVGFTAYSEYHPPEDVITLLREFHRRMSNVVFEHGGTVDNYIGDCLMATFGVPRATGDEAATALRCARTMIDELGRWNRERQTGGDTLVDARIGVHFGPVVMGTIGGEHNMSFAVIGDTPNVASRLQALTRSLNAAIAASDTVVATVRQKDSGASGDLTGLRDCGEQTIRGREHGVRVWALPASA